MNKPRLQEKYEKEILPSLMKSIGVSNPMAAPTISKIVVNAGVGDAVKNKEFLAKMKEDMAIITGQVPSVRKARKSVASFSVREGNPIGLASTLRGKRMWIFLDKLISIVLPRLRDFRGLSNNSFDANGNYSIGIVDHTIFPEVGFSKSGGRGLQVTIVTSTNSVDISGELLTLLGVQFKKEEDGS